VPFMIGAWVSISSVVLVLAYYGIPLTAPLPDAFMLFWPFFGTFMSAAQSGLGGALLLFIGVHEWTRARGLRRVR